MINVLYAVMSERLPATFEDYLVFNSGEYEIMIFQVPVLIEVEGEMRSYPPHTCILYKPGQLVHYRAERGELVYDWIRFNCDEPLYTEDFLPFGVPVYCTDYYSYIVYWKAVANENFWKYPSKQYAMEELMRIILQRLHDFDVLDESENHRKVFMELRTKILQHPDVDWTLERMAAEVNMSVRSLQKYYKHFFHISCINEVIESRINYARLLLIRTEDSIVQISKKCGYKNMEHFCRQFKAKTGITPSQFRAGNIL